MSTKPTLKNRLQTWLRASAALPIRAAAGDVSPETPAQADENSVALTAVVGFADLVCAEGQPKKRPTFSISAYTGAVVQLGNFYYPVIVDLTGLKAARSKLPVLLDHDLRQIVGQGEAKIDASGVRIDGLVTGDDECATKVVAHAKNGFEWQASIGASITRREMLEAGKNAIVNGRQVTGPMVIAREAVLQEVSFTALGADGQTTAQVAASQVKGESAMNFEQWLKAKGWDPATIAAGLKAALQAEFDAEVKANKFSTPTVQNQTPPAGNAQPGNAPLVAQVVTPDAQASQPNNGANVVAEAIKAMREESLRLAAIEKHCGTKHPELKQRALAENWTADRTELEVMRASRSQGPAIHVVQQDTSPRVLEAALCQTLKLGAVDKAFDAPTLQAAHTQYKGRLLLSETLLALAWQNGYQGHSFHRDRSGVIRAAFSTMQATDIFSNLANKLLLQSFMATEQAWRKIAAIRGVNDFKEAPAYRLTADAEFKELGADGELVHGDIDEESYGNKADTYGRIFGLSRKHMVNDDLGALEQITKLIGRGFGLKLNKIFWTEWLDNASFFTTGNLNYAEGAGTALSIDALTQAEQLFLDQKDGNGDPLGLQAMSLLVPTALSAKAAQLHNSTEIRNTTASTKEPTGNPHAGKFEPVVSSYLNNANYPGYSAKAHYLVANPADLAAIEVVFLNGNEQPTVETVEAEPDKLGLYFRGYGDYGVRKQDYRAATKLKGEA